jgi:hypothetical protein
MTVTGNQGHRGSAARSWPGIAGAIALALGMVAAPGRAAAQATLAVEGDHFTVNNQPRFLTFISYFDGLDSVNSGSDFQYLHAMGFDGVRVFPNWWTVAGSEWAGDTLIRSDGSLDPDTVARFHGFLSSAEANGLVVDMSFSAETVSTSPSGPPTLTMGALLVGLQRAAAEFAGHHNVLFDLQNESDINRPLQIPAGNRQGFSVEELTQMRNAVKGGDPRRIVTASATGDVRLVPWRALGSGQDVVAWHDARASSFAADTTPSAQLLRAGGIPVYFQEPPKADDIHVGNADLFRAAIASAKAQGAAAWCYHHGESHVLNGTTLQNTLSAVSRDFVNSVRGVLNATPWGANLPRRFQLQTIQDHTWVSADQGGGGQVTADRAVNSIWETFEIVDLNGGNLQSGDPVALRTFDHVHYLQATSGGGSSVNATPTAVGPWETFTILKQGGGSTVIFEGDWIALRANSGHYVVAENGGGPGSVVNANRVAVGAWETFGVHFP